METSDRGGLLSAGGILSILVGAFEIIAGSMFVVSMAFGLSLWEACPWGGQDISKWFALGSYAPALTVMIIMGIALLVLGILALVGGISAIKRGSFGMAMIGAICALLPINILGLFAVIFVALAKGEFAKEE